MMKPKMAIATVLTAALAACSATDDVTAPMAPSSKPTTAALVDQSTTQDFPYSWTGPNPCNGDVLTLTGTSHIITHATLNGNGAHIDEHFMSDGTGQGAPPSFKEYSGSADDRYQSNMLTITTVLNEDHRMLVRGPTRADDFFFHTVYHITVNANGVPTATVDKYDARCKG